MSGRVIAVVAAGCLLLIVLSGCGGGGPSLSGATFLGSDSCKGCHQDEYDDMFKASSGHPFKLNRVVNGQPPTYPHSVVPNPPPGYGWNDVSWVIGGYGWKARFIDQQGYIITGNQVQWNLATEEWVAYHASDQPGTKPYNCGRCHTTGWVETGLGGPHQDGMPGMYGTFAEPGIGCEACHGPGSVHVANPKPDNIVVDTSSEQCGTCHFRDAQHRIEAKGGFIRHHEQYDEMISAGHATLQCVDCHDAHAGTRYGPGLVRPCQSCHPGPRAARKHNMIPNCLDCHMPRATKSATKAHDYEGDVRTHIF
ncbi:MAG: multiheme c-type cytochrome, partial [Armatimonadota bacterium]